jgi:hypothetical protein
VLVIGAVGHSADPTGAPSNRFRFFLQIRQALQTMGLHLAWVPLGYDRRGRLSHAEVRAFEMQAAALGDSLAGVLLLDPGYEREMPLWSAVADSVACPVVWFHTSPLDDLTPNAMPSHCHILEPNWELAGAALAEHLSAQYHPQRVLLLPGPGEAHLHRHLDRIRIDLSKMWGGRWLDVLDWKSVFPDPIAARSPSFLDQVLRLALQDTGIRPYDLDIFFAAALGTQADLWICADDLLALAALEHLDRRRSQQVRPAVIGFGNHPFALQRGLCTVEVGWSALVERAVEIFTGIEGRGDRAKTFVIPGPSGTPSRESPLTGIVS